jgi:hypothetical protein
MSGDYFAYVRTWVRASMPKAAKVTIDCESDVVCKTAQFRLVFKRYTITMAFCLDSLPAVFNWFRELEDNFM